MKSLRTQRRNGGTLRVSTAAMAMALLVSLILGVMACGEADNDLDRSSTSTSTGPSASTDTTGDGLPDGASSDDLVLKIAMSGGEVPLASSLTNTPEFALYADGRVIVTGAVPEIYPTQALPNLQTTTVSEQEIDRIVDSAQTVGLLADANDYGTLGIADAPTTTFVLVSEGKTYTNEVYALGMEEGTSGITAEQQQKRAALSDFRAQISDLAGLLGRDVSWTDYEFSSLAVYVQAVGESEATDATEVQPNRLDWPLDDLATSGQQFMSDVRRLVVSGSDLKKLSPLLDEATEITLWSSEDKLYHLYFRPLLPDEQ
jgi:hypothetical protein